MKWIMPGGPRAAQRSILRLDHLAFAGGGGGHGVAGVDDKVGAGGELVEIEGGVVAEGT